MHEILESQHISAAIIDVIKTTEQRAYLVSPYVNLWPLLERTLASATAQGKRITFIVRAEPENMPGFAALHRQFGCEVIALEHLHTKLYMNETRAIVGSMNLYDISQRRNHELALLIRARHEVRDLREKVLQRDLLALPPKHHWRDRFHSEEAATTDEMLALEAGFADRGFCVSCGTKIALDNPRRPTSASYVRCKPCWAQAPEVIGKRFPITHCHYCGEAHRSVLSQPFHPQCLSMLGQYAEWRETAVITPVR